MLPTSLVRARISKGRITPIFASREDAGLASIVLDEFKKAYEGRERKGLLIDRMKELEYYNDYRLVRGLYTILERRCVFKCIDSPIHPMVLRREVFKESSMRGYALTHGERKSIIDGVASRLKIDSSSIEEVMWSDLDENLLIEEFRPMTPESLIAVYNLALMQGMLLNCTRLECSVMQGVEWKCLLREVKRLGLMYMLDDYKGDEHTPHLMCVIDGPASIFKLTDRYGVAMARLIPALLKAKAWWMRAWIVRKGTGVDAKKLYEFKFSSKDAMEIDLLLPSSSSEGYGDDDYGGEHGSYRVYDSSVEERFATLFNQYGTGWRLVREPEPIVLSGKVLIPDFLLEKYGKKVYIEIVGFWTKEYLERKVQKLMQVKSKGIDYDMIVMINKDLICSEPIHIEHLLTAGMRVVTYDGKSMPIRQIMDHLKSIEDEMTSKHISDDALLMDVKAYVKGLKDNNTIVSIKDVAERFNITYDATLSILTSMVQMGELPNYEMVMNTLIISKDMLEDIRMKIGMYERFTDACKVLEGYGVPEECYSSLLSTLGYTVVWKDIDMSNAVIVRGDDEKYEKEEGNS